MKDSIIDQSLIDYLALDLSIRTFIGSDKTIVPKELRHLFILENHDVGTSTIEYYYTPSSRFVSDQEYQAMANMGFAGKKETTFDPYPFIFYGAYVSRNDLLVKLNELCSRDRVATYKGKKINVFGDLYPYYEDYATGFKFGFENFENEHIVPYTNLFNQDSAKINKVFEYVTKEIWFKYSWYNNHRGFKTKTSLSLSSPRIHKIIEAYEQGEEQGYYYKAWSIILSNKDIFEPLFEKLNKEAEKEIENLTDEKDSTSSSEGVTESFKFKNNFDHVSEDKVYQYFNDNLVHKKYLTKNDLHNYLKSAFDKKETPTELFIIINSPTKQKIMKIFYKYYTDIAAKTYGKQIEYAALLGDYFAGYKTPNVSSNFNK